MAEYRGKQVTLDKPFRLPAGSSKKFGVYVKAGDKVKKVTFGDPNMEIRRDDPDARANFRARHNCDTQKDKTSAAYWSCLLWSKSNVSDLVKFEEEPCIGSDGRYHFLYEVVNSDNGKKYYGVHSTNSLDDGYLGSGTALKAAVKKYGKGSFDKKYLEFFDTREDLLAAEELLVNESIVKSSDYYNLALGGRSFVDSLRELSEEDFLAHQSKAGKAGGRACYALKSDEEKTEWHKKGRQASSGTLGKTLNIKDLESYKRVRSKTAIARKRYHCPECGMGNLDGGNLYQHYKKAHEPGLTKEGFEELKKGTSVSELTKLEGKVLKADDEQRIVYGWASVISENGEPVVDRQGDVIEAEVLVKAITDFMEHVRVGKAMHKGDQVGTIIHSFPVTKELGDALGIHSDREGWIVAYKVYDEGVWGQVKSGELSAFSIGGRAVKEDI